VSSGSLKPYPPSNILGSDEGGVNTENTRFASQGPSRSFRPIPDQYPANRNDQGVKVFRTSWRAPAHGNWS